MKFTICFLLVTQLLYSQQQSSSMLTVPEWAKDAVWYQIFPERFANGDTTNDPTGVEPWGAKPKRQNYFGGDLKGIIDRLEYLQDLGVNALYLNPIFESNTNHKYHATDYYKIDDNFGSEETFKQFLNECHKRNIRVIIDGVFNHTGRDFFAFDDIIKNEKNSQYVDWYKIHSFPIGPPDKPNYECWWGHGDLPKLMADTPAVRKYLLDVTRHWTKSGIDGWRLDVPNEMSHNFWIEWRKVVREENPDAYIVGELWEDATAWLQGDQFDAVMNYRFRNAVLDYFVNGLTSVTEFDSALEQVREDYPEEATYVMQNLIGSHDTERFLTLLRGEVDKLKVTALFQMTYIGAPMIYYGDEIGMEGGKDPDCRRTMEWDEPKWDSDLRNWYKKLIKLRNEHSVLRRGSFRTAIIDDEHNIFGFWRESEENSAIIIVNNDNIEQTVSILPDTEDLEWSDMLNGVKYKVTGNEIKDVVLPPNSGAVLMPLKTN